MSQQTTAAQQDKPTKRGPRTHASSVKPVTLSLPGLMQYIDRSKTWIFAAMRESGFPRPIKTGGKNSNLWFVSEVDAYLEKQRVRRDLSTTSLSTTEGAR